MHIVYASSEAAPFSKTGGLGDVAGSLPGALAALGHEVDVFTPYYRCARKVDPKAEKVADGAVPVGTEMAPWVLRRSSLAIQGASCYFIEHDGYFDREGLYSDARGDYSDSCSRFIFFSRAVLAASQALERPVDVFHANDWQCALIPVYLKLSLSEHPFFHSAASLFTIHNLAYQGLFWHWDWPLLNLPWRHFNWKELEFHGKLNLLKGALVHADALNTVSPAYAREIQTAEHGCGLDGALGDRAEDLFGVVNGIDPQAWNPRSDPHLPAAYDAEDLAGKAACREALLKRFKLPADASGAVVGIVGRLVEQKGFDLVAQALDELARRNLLLVVLGTGDPRLQERLEKAARRHGERIAAAFAFDNGLAHLLTAGSDALLMPSRFEPCGLNQLYALRYGTVPIVHAVGGLGDTVTDATEAALADGTATGFAFQEFTPQGLLGAVDRALALRQGDPAAWTRLQRTGMGQDWSWPRSAERYVELYERAKRKAALRSV
ncbi:MAG: glycogen synthase GlgA [Planctomycetota bacterium]|nr:glycogen synthase GlgA [Planctomycetota bacterium]